MASLVRIILREFSFLTGVYEVFDANYASEKTGARILWAWKFVWGQQTSRKSKSRRSSKAKRRVKSPPDSGTVDSDWYVFCFNLAHFTLHSSWHVLGCVNFVLAPDMFVICIPHVYYTRERVTCAGVCYGDTERAFEALLERLSSFFVVLLTCRFALCLFITESKSRVKHETNPQVLFSSFVFSCADKFTGRLFWGVFKHRNDEIPKCENQVKSRSSKITIRSGSWGTRSATHGWPPWFATVKRCILTQKLCWVPFATKSPPRTSKRHRTSPVEITTRPVVRRRKKDPKKRRISWRSPIHVLTPPDRA